MWPSGCILSSKRHYSTCHITDWPVHILGILFNPFSFLVFPTGPAGGFVLSLIAFSSLYMMRFENLSSAGTLEVSGFSVSFLITFPRKRLVLLFKMTEILI